MPIFASRRLLFLRIGIALLVIVGAIGVYALLQPGTLATRTVDHNGSALDFRLWQRHGRVYAGCGQAIVSLGSSDALDTSDSAILLDESAGVVTLRVGQHTMTYDLTVRRFTSPAIP